jgi:hypothetical protein
MLVTTFLLLVAVGGGTQWIRTVATVLFLLSLPKLARRSWWHYVKTGESLREPVALRYRQPGVCRVELVSVGARYIDVVKALREVRALTLVEAKRLTDSVPAAVADDLSQSSAKAMADRIAEAGGTARIVGAEAND